MEIKTKGSIGHGVKGTRRQGDNKTRRQGRRQGEKAAEPRIYIHYTAQYIYILYTLYTLYSSRRLRK